MNNTLNIAPREVIETECDRYNFETPGKIQSHGAMLIMQEPGFKIVQLSQNTSQIIGIDHKQMINQPIASFLEPKSAEKLLKSTKSTNFSMINPIRLKFLGNDCDVILLRYDGFLIAEVEPVRSEVDNNDAYQMGAMQAMEKFQSAVFVEQLIEIATNEIRELTDFDRVMYYKFDEDYNGQVVAEATVRGVDSFLGLYFPASDIPNRVRQLYMNTKSRYLPDLHEAQIALFPEINPVTKKGFDMSMTILRAVAPTHIEYMRNLGINSSLSFSIMKEGRLIGMFACHHYSGKFVPYVNRLVCEQIVEMFVNMLLQLDDDSVHIDKLSNYKQNALESIQSNQHQAACTALQSMVGAEGVAISKDGNLTFAGFTPTEDEIKSLLEVFANPSYNLLYQEDPNGFFVTSKLSSVFDGAEAIKHAASGVLVVPISKNANDFIIWFRPERVLSATWAGNPDQAMHIDEKTMRISPRKSFSAWQKNVENTSESWKSYEVQMALQLRDALL